MGDQLAGGAQVVLRTLCVLDYVLNRLLARFLAHEALSCLFKLLSFEVTYAAPVVAAAMRFAWWPCSSWMSLRASRGGMDSPHAASKQSARSVSSDASACGKRRRRTS